MMTFEEIPSTLTSAPTLAYVEPGQCQFTTEFTAVTLLKRWKVSPTTSVLRFGLPNSDAPLNLSTCACILSKADLPKNDSDEKEAVIRPYTPISTNAQIGSFDLLIKDYGPEKGRMSHYLCTTLAENETVEFKHIQFNIKMQYPEMKQQYTNVCMIVGGTGITPMLQAAHAILGDTTNTNIKLTMLYGSRSSDDILGHELLDSWKDQLEVVHVLSHEPTDSKWNDGVRGFIDNDLIAKHFPPPSDEKTVIFVCGPPIMYDIMCGPRTDAELSGVLAEMGYTQTQVYKF